MFKKTCLLILALISLTYANGVAVVNGSTPEYFDLLSSHIEVSVENQVAVTTTAQTFVNHMGGGAIFKYAFPLSEQASAVSLRWCIGGEWHTASFSASPQDTSMTGGDGEDIDSNLKNYLGNTPLYFPVSEVLPNDSLVIIELTYVELLPYSYGKVDYTYPNNYQLIQTAPLDSQYFKISISSERNIDTLGIKDHPTADISNDGHLASIEYRSGSLAADMDYEVEYSLALDELGLFGLSTFLVDSLVPDGRDQGFFTFVAEPDPGESMDVIDKVFTLIIDRSGSMMGSKIIQARNAATFIVEHLNEGDKFNIVDFASDISSFQPAHVEYNSSNEQAAITYISNLIATGSTNISGAFDTAVPQFSAANDSTANIIIFFTDGQATAGITGTTSLVTHINDLVTSTETDMMIHTFGIGSYVNEQLLTLIASENNGLTEFLGDDELEDKITEFYLKIRNPVLLNTGISFSPDIISEVYPSPLPNLYKGQQMIVTGRYASSDSLTITLNGKAFAKSVEYEYVLTLSDSSDEKYQFLPKLWAKKKIEHLLIAYYALPEGSAEALGKKEEIVSLSLLFGVITPFTSFSETDPTSIEEINDAMDEPVAGTYELLGNYPNPFNPSTLIRFKVSSDISEVVRINIYSLSGKLVRVLFAYVNGAGDYEVFWDGVDMKGVSVPSGTYIYVLDAKDHVLSAKMTLLK